jgi:hypothetical protein
MASGVAPRTTLPPVTSTCRSRPCSGARIRAQRYVRACMCTLLAPNTQERCSPSFARLCCGHHTRPSDWKATRLGLLSPALALLRRALMDSAKFYRKLPTSVLLARPFLIETSSAVPPFHAGSCLAGRTNAPFALGGASQWHDRPSSLVPPPTAAGGVRRQEFPKFQFPLGGDGPGGLMHRTR